MNATVAVSTLQDTIRRALATFPAERARIERGAALIALGAVTIGADAAHVASQTGDGTVYLVTDQACECRDSQRHPGQLCKHQYAYTLLMLAEERQRRLNARQSEQARRARVTADAVALAYARRIGWPSGTATGQCVRACGNALPADWSGNLCPGCADATFARRRTAA